MGAKIEPPTEDKDNEKVGPGLYNPNEDIKHWKPPAYSMGIKGEDKKKEDEGPGFLYPNIDLTREKKPEWTMGNEGRLEKKLEEGPGPGEYYKDEGPGKGKPKWTMEGKNEYFLKIYYIFSNFNTFYFIFIQ